jgi:membrane glycosyltransferase
MSNFIMLHRDHFEKKQKQKCPAFHGRVIHIVVSLVLTPLVDPVVSGEHAVSILKAKVTWSSQRWDDQTKDIARLHLHARYKERGQSEIREGFSDFSRSPPPFPVSELPMAWYWLHLLYL